MSEQPQITIGILHAERIAFVLQGGYRDNEGRNVEGEQSVRYVQNGIEWNGAVYERLCFTPSDKSSKFLLRDVVIGIGFHWQRTEDQTFRGGLEFIVEDGMLTAVNRIGVESYLFSVIASEMSASASPALLRAHAVISRSWVLAQIAKRDSPSRTKGSRNESQRKDPYSRIRWYDREEHMLYDVCADDHCQRYQGITRTYGHEHAVREAIEATWGEVLTYDGEICDARFSKCCGGVSEAFESCWEEVPHPYLIPVRDNGEAREIPDLTDEAAAERWITTHPESYCDTQDPTVLGQVLNGYDRETSDFYRWQVSYTAEELSELVARRSGIDFGTILNLVPVERGASGRLVRLKIVGTKRAMIIGKELEIRRILSETHLYSSAFVVRREGNRFILLGAGWGHGVGLCQIGAAVMGAKGIPYDRILLHYYTGARIEKLYKRE